MRNCWKPNLARKIQQRVAAPSSLRENDISRRIVRMIGCDHLRDGFTDHRIPNLQRFSVGLSVIHAPAHVGVEGKILDAQQNLPETRCGNCGFLKTEVGQLGFAIRSCSENDLSAGRAVHAGFSIGFRIRFRSTL
jgi:hypothetical protein